MTTNGDVFEQLRVMLAQLPAKSSDEERERMLFLLGLSLVEKTLNDVRRVADALERMASAQEQLIQQLSSRTW